MCVCRESVRERPPAYEEPLSREGFIPLILSRADGVRITARAHARSPRENGVHSSIKKVSSKRLTKRRNAVRRFLARHAANVTGVVSGFDRVVFRGSLPRLLRTLGMYYFLNESGVRLLDFKAYVQRITKQIQCAAKEEAALLDRPLVFITNSKASKEEMARQFLARDQVKEGLICSLAAVEPCRTFEYERSKDRTERGLKLYSGKCLHLYKYWIDPVFGFMSGRLQTWFPMQIQICINGREWLAHQMRKRSIRFRQARNCFPWISDVVTAQTLLHEQLKTAWPEALGRIARMLNPLHDEIFKDSPCSYYWSAYQTEWATDVMFRSPAALADVYEDLVRFAMSHFKSPDVMRFLADKAPGNYIGPIMTSFKDRVEGSRVKHWQGGNSIKMYDKAASILRIETTIGNPDEFKVFRPINDGPDKTLRWLPLRKGVADLHRRAEVSARSNDLYLEALSNAPDTTPCSKIFDPVSRPAFDTRRVRPLRLSDPDDLSLLEAVSRGEFTIAGFRNRDIRRLLFHPADSPEAARRLTAKTGRLLRILRAHNLIKKIPHTTRYRLTAQGLQLTAALFAARNADISCLLKLAA